MLTIVNKYSSYNGLVEFYRHDSVSTATPMAFSVFRPPQAKTGPVPWLLWLSGLTCTEENFMAKSGVQRVAAELGILVVAPDTSPRGANIPGEGDHWDFGLGAGYYLNATDEKWAKHYRMYDYITQELPEIVRQNFPVIGDREGIFGHSMGGHGAMVAALRQPGRYRSVSAFSPICAPSLSPWGRKAFNQFLGGTERSWREWDSHYLVVEAKERLPILIDQGTEDKFLREQLLLGVFQEVCHQVNHPITVRFHEGYDHSYYFIATFIEDHLRYHAQFLK